MLFWGLIAVVLWIVVLGVCAAFVGPSVWRAARDGRSALIEGAQAVTRKDGAAAGAEFAAARDLFATSASKLDSPLAWPLRITPIASTHVGVARSLATIGSRIGDAGVAISATMQRLPAQQLTFTKGKVDLRLVHAAHDALAASVRDIPAISDALRGMPTGWVGGPLSAPRRQALTVLPELLDGVQKAEAALAGLPSILAEGGAKRYLVAFSNLSELRGSGGLFGYVTSLRARDGDLDLESLSGRPTDLFPKPAEAGVTFPTWFPDDFRTQAGIFQNINMTTDFPTVGHLVVQTATKKAGPLNGVIAVDPIGISAILGLTGPIRLPTWPTIIDADNVAQIAMHDVYIAIPTDTKRREDFFAQLVRTAFDKLTSTTIRLTPKTAGVFDDAVRGANFRMYSTNADDEATFERIGAAGEVARASDATDVLSVVSENATGSKGDWFLRRDIRYVVKLDPKSLNAIGSLTATFRNTAPSAGLPDYIIGSFIPGLPKGTDRQIVVLVRSQGDKLLGFAVDGDPAVHNDAREDEFHAYRSTVDVAPGGGSQVIAGSLIPNALIREGDELVYRLHVMKQAVANPDFIDVEIGVPPGWQASGESRYVGDMKDDVVLELRMRRTVRGSIVRTLITDPFRWLKHQIGRVL